MTTTPTEWTTVIAVDRGKLGQLAQVWPTWVKNRPEICQHPLVVLRDASLPESFLHFLLADYPRVEIVEWGWREDLDQRERMLTAFVTLAPKVVKTPWWVKIDVDSVALRPDPWLLPEWFEGSTVMVGGGWPYTKPPGFLFTLEDWGDVYLPAYPRVGFDRKYETWETYPMKRLASWICWLRTDWSRWAASLLPSDGRLPVPSQDTYHWYLARRTGARFQLVNWKKHGWVNCHTGRFRAEKVAEALAEHSEEKTEEPIHAR